jgi:hypothetical protein
MVMMSQRIILDTSAVNKLAKEPDAQPLIAGLKCGYDVGLTAMSVDELLAPSKAEYRKIFFECCRQISREVVCLMPTGLLIQRMVAVYSNSPGAFDWTRVNVRLKVYEDAILRDEGITANDALSGEQRESAEKTSGTFEEWFTNLRPKLQEIYEKAGQKPHVYGDVIRQSLEPAGVFWGFAKELYRCAQEWSAAPDGPDPERRESDRISLPDDDTIKRFVDACPPFRAAVLAYIITWYDRCLRETHGGPKFKAGRVDQLMSVYLPYCHQFITHDKDQGACLQEIAKLCDLKTQVRLYAEFYSSFMVLAC